MNARNSFELFTDVIFIGFDIMGTFVNLEIIVKGIFNYLNCQQAYGYALSPEAATPTCNDGKQRLSTPEGHHKRT